MSHIGEMKICFISDFRIMKYDPYIDIPKQIVERNLIEKIYENPKPKRSLQKMPEPVINEYNCYFYSEYEDEDVDDI